MVFRIRLFLIYFFSSKRVERSAYFYSHFEIISKYKNLNVNVFVYDGAVEGILELFFVTYYNGVKRINRNPRKRKPIAAFEPFKMLVLLNFLHEFNIYIMALKTCNSFN